MREPGSRPLCPLLASRAVQIATAAAVALLGAIGFAPLFAGPGYEAALAAGLVLPTVAAMAASYETVRHQLRPLRAYERGLAIGAWLAALGYAVALLHGLRAGLCDLWGGTLYYWLGGGWGACMGGAWGAIAGTISG